MSRKSLKKQLDGMSIGQKVLWMLSGLGILMILICVLNVAALATMKEYNVAIEERLATYEEHIHAGDTTGTAELEEEMDYYFNKSDIKIDGTYVFNIILVVMSIIVIIVCSLLASKIIAAPAKKASGQLGDIIGKIEAGHGDLTARLNVKSKDEIGQLVKGINAFIAQLQNLIKNLKEEAGKMYESAENVTAQVGASNENAVNVSAAMEEMSASMEEVAATVEQLAEGSNKVLAQLQEVSAKAIEGTQLVDTIKKNSGAMYRETVDSKEKAHEVIGEIREELAVSVEDSKSVDKIKELTDQILGIAGQTNLLALNASIEAARAGEAGKGFAVVADEIRVLADSSRSTANNIQEISEVVTVAVEKLAKSAEHMLKFVDEKVISDYDSFVGIVEQYRSDAESINEILDEFANSAASVNAVMESMNQGLNDISVTVDETAKGVSDVAENTSELVNAMSLIQDESVASKNISETLTNEVNKFEIV